ncbi:MAG: DEAD-box ATP-dependent RNA helicase CshA [Firmicutes bacterium ADurb.Bin193]|nr:MAG: DEAD-box ATP-dependent RNA helicase CshA [Firmicutes bacterium ADurb.Bin193]
MRRITDINSFEELGIKYEIQKAVKEIGYESPTAIQEKTIPILIRGADVIGHSQTGSGKTAAFGIPALMAVNPSHRATQILVLCPTRELAVQSCGEIRKFAKYMHGIRTIPVYGGQPIDRQIRELKSGAHIVIGTPGRIIDHIERHTLRLNHIKMVVLDEADEMLNMGFREDIEKILSFVPEKRQTALFSATMSEEILAITHKYQTEPQLVKTKQKQLTVSSVEQYYYEVPRGKKTEVLCRLIEVNNTKRSMVFCNTKRQVDELVAQLNARGLSAEGLHGDMKQASRNSVMAQFKSGSLEILVATDVAARGIDVDDVECVFNYDIPLDMEYYVHRIGRTGRAGKEGKAHMFVTGGRQYALLKEIQKYTKSTIIHRAVPSLAEISAKKSDDLKIKVLNILKTDNLKAELEVVDKLLIDGYTSSEVAAVLIRIISGGDNENEALSPVYMPDEYSRMPKAGKGMARIKLSIGKTSKIAAKHIVGAIAGASGIPGGEIGKIEIFDYFTIADIPAHMRDEIVSAMRNIKINGKTTNVEPIK